MCACAPALSAEQQCLSAPTATDKHQLKSSFPKAGNPTWPQRELHCWLTPQPRLINSCCLNSSILLGVHRCRLPLRDFPSRCGDGKRKHSQKAGKVSSERGGSLAVCYSDGVHVFYSTNQEPEAIMMGLSHQQRAELLQCHQLICINRKVSKVHLFERQNCTSHSCISSQFISKFTLFFLFLFKRICFSPQFSS